MNWMVRPLKLFYFRFIRLRATPEEVARGFAIGIFIGMTPTLWFQMVLAALFAALLKQNKLAAILGVWITNPLTSIPIYTFNYEVGRRVLGTPPLQVQFHTLTHIEAIMKLGWNFVSSLCVGCFIVGIISAFISYWLAKPLYSFFIKRRQLRFLRAQQV